MPKRYQGSVIEDKPITCFLQISFLEKFPMPKHFRDRRSGKLFGVVKMFIAIFFDLP
jgi:hypothetical protein